MNSTNEPVPLAGRRTPLRTSEPPRPVEYVVDRLLALRRLTILAAAAGIGKSLLAMFIAVHVALGLPVLGRTVRKGRVLYVDYETDADVLRRTAARILQALGLTLDDPDLDIVVYEPAHPLSTAAGLAELREAVERENAVLVVVDSLSLGSAGADVSSSLDMTPALVTLSRLGVAVLALDHVTKSAAAGQSAPTPIGTVLKTAAARAVLTLTRGRGGYTLSVAKWNLSAPPPPLHFAVEFEGDEGAITYHSLSAPASASDDPESLSDDATLVALTELFRELGRAVSPTEIAARRGERSGRAVAKESTANRLTSLKKLGLADNPIPGVWVPVVKEE